MLGCSPAFWFLLSVHVTLLSACGEVPRRTESHVKIIGGSESTTPPYFVLLHYKDEPTPFCGGTLIEKNLVLTAAHCASAAPKPIEVWLGVKQLSDLPASVGVEAVEVHPQYNKNSIRYDLALLHLASSAGTKRVSPIQYFEVEESFKTLRVYGFGSLSAVEAVFPDRIHSVNVDVLPSYQCESLGGPYGEVFENQLCAGDLEEGKRDSCFGDSGGPLVTEEVTPRLYGIVSWGVGCGARGQPGVYTKVRSFGVWIAKHKSSIETRLLDEMIGSVFYFPLEYLEPGAGGVTLRFSAAYGLWKEVADLAGFSVQSWKRAIGSRVLELELISISRSKYRLRARFGEKVYETAVHYSRS